MATADFDDILDGFDPAKDPVVLILTADLNGHDQGCGDIFHRCDLAG
jgi:hypothetical protein